MSEQNGTGTATAAAEDAVKTRVAHDDLADELSLRERIVLIEARQSRFETIVALLAFAVLAGAIAVLSLKLAVRRLRA